MNPNRNDFYNDINNVENDFQEYQPSEERCELSSNPSIIRPQEQHTEQTIRKKFNELIIEKQATVRGKGVAGEYDPNNQIYGKLPLFKQLVSSLTKEENYINTKCQFCANSKSITIGTKTWHFALIDLTHTLEWDRLEKQGQKGKTFNMQESWTIANQWNTKFLPSVVYENSDYVEYEPITKGDVIRHYDKCFDTDEAIERVRKRNLNIFHEELFTRLVTYDTTRKDQDGNPVLTFVEKNCNLFLKASAELKKSDHEQKKRKL